MRLKLSLWCLLGFIGIAFGSTAERVTHVGGATATKSIGRSIGQSSFHACAAGCRQKRSTKKDQQNMTPSGKRALRQSDENDFYRAKRAPQLDGDIPAERYLEAQKRMNAMPRYATADEQVLPSRNASLNVAADERLGTWGSARSRQSRRTRAPF